MKKHIILIAFLFLSFSNLFAQFSADVDGSLDVSNVNCSYTYTYPISNNAIDGYSLNTSLTYAPNVVWVKYERKGGQFNIVTILGHTPQLIGVIPIRIGGLL